MRIEWNKVTWYSKVLAVVVFIISGILWFYIGMRYKEAVSVLEMSTLQQAPIHHTTQEQQAASSRATIANNPSQLSLYDPNQWTLLKEEAINLNQSLSGAKILTLRSKNFVGACGACEIPNLYALNIIIAKDSRVLYEFAPKIPPPDDM